MAFIFLLISLAHAAQGFHCFSIPNLPVQSYEYGSNNCGGVDSTAQAKKLNSGDGERDVLCVYQALCKPVSDKEATKEPPPQTVADLMPRAGQGGDLKASVLLCRGKGQIQAGTLYQSTCPTPTQCQRDVLYNAAGVSVAPPLPASIALPGSAKGVK